VTANIIADDVVRWQRFEKRCLERFERTLRLGKTVGEVIQRFHVTPGQLFVILARVSSCQQGKRGNLDAQETMLRRAVTERGGIVVKVLRKEYSGHGDGWLDYLHGEAFQAARRAGATLLAATLDRLLRNPSFESRHRKLCLAQPTDDHLFDLHFTACPIRTICPIMTYLPPDATPAQCRSLLSSWGQEQKGRKGGRPIKGRDAFRQHWQPVAMELATQGMSLHAIARELRRLSGHRPSHETIRSWVRQANTTAPQDG
jgi:hypothetical protein